MDAAPGSSPFRTEVNERSVQSRRAERPFSGRRGIYLPRSEPKPYADPTPYGGFDVGRKALVARRFVETRFGDDEAYGVTSGERFAMEDDVFAAVAGYARVDPESLVETAPADD